jgi:hypothetical protein
MEEDAAKDMQLRICDEIGQEWLPQAFLSKKGELSLIHYTSEVPLSSCQLQSQETLVILDCRNQLTSHGDGAKSSDPHPQMLKTPPKRAFISLPTPDVFQKVNTQISFPQFRLSISTFKMKRSSVILAALLSGFALASPDDGACGQATVTVTQVITTTLGSDNASAPSQAVVAVGSQAGSAPSVAAGGAIDAAAPTSIAIPSTVADPSVAAPPVVNDSAASAIIDAPSAPTDSSSPSADGPGGDATDDPDGTQGDSAPVTVTEVVTSIINGGARTITVTNVATHYSAPTPAVPVVTTVTKVYTSIVNGGAGTITGERFSLFLFMNRLFFIRGYPSGALRNHCTNPNFLQSPKQRNTPSVATTCTGREPKPDLLVHQHIM